MSAKSKGSNAERDLLKKFWAKGWAAMRAAGSGSNPLPSPDIIAGTPLRKLAIECKATKSDYKYLTKEEIEQLKEFARVFGSEAWVAIKFDRTEWFFVSLDDLKETAEHFVITKEKVKKIGLRVEEVIA